AGIGFGDPAREGDRPHGPEREGEDHEQRDDVEPPGEPPARRGAAHAAAPRSSASASRGSMRPSYSARPVMAPSSTRASGWARRRMSSMPLNPPEAMTGMETARASARVASQLMPASTPSRSMSV